MLAPLLVLSIGAIILAGSFVPATGHLDTGHSIRLVSSSEAADIDLSLPNTGLKNPDDITWPNADEFGYVYDADMGDMLSAMQGMSGRITIESTVEPSAAGGRLEDILKTETSQQGMRMVMSMNFDAQYDASHRATSIGFSMGTKIYSKMPMKLPDKLFSYTGELRDGKLIEDFKGSPMTGMKNSHSERPAPDDGFFFAGGTSTPGLTALLLAALDIEDGKEATVWMINPDLPQGGPLEMEAGFFRARICRLDKCDDGIRDTWDESRGELDNWKPDGDTKAYALYPLPYTSEVFDGLYFAYVDNDGRLIRLEEPLGPEPVSLTLTKTLKKSSAWWGDVKSE